MRKPILAAALAAVVILLALQPFGLRSRAKLDKVELEAFLDEMSSRFPNGTSRYVDSPGISFQMDEDGALQQINAQPIRILLRPPWLLATQIR